MRIQSKKTWLYFSGLLALAACLWACRVTDSGGDQYLTWNLSDAYKDYDTVSIKLVDAKDSTLVYEVVWNAKIPDPAHFPKYKLTAAKDKDFTIQIRGYNANHELLLSKDVEVVGAKPKSPVVLLPDMRLRGLSVSPAALTPVFDPNQSSYSAQVGDSVSSITLTATPIDAGNVLTLNQKVSAWSQGVSQELQPGANVIDVTVSTADGKISKSYELVVTRGRVIPPEEITSLTLQDKSLTLFTGDGPTAQKATVVPAGALLQWTSLDESIVRVDGGGRLTPVAPGMAKVIVKAGALADTADVTVKKDSAVLVAILSPGKDTLVNSTPITIKYEVNGNVHSESRDLTEGLNVLSIDSGNGASVKVTLDTQPPNPPNVTGTSPTNTAPKWTWITGGGGGSGTFRYKPGDSTLAGSADTKETTYTLAATPVSGTTYKLYVAEKDSAGNWSPSTGYAILYDVSKPTVAIVTPQASGTYLTKSATVAFSGTASGPNAIVKVSYKINSVAAADAVFDKGNWSIASVPVVEGSTTLVTVIATDNLGNSGESSLSLLRDNTPPSDPTLTAFPPATINSNKGSWAWSAGSDGTGGSGLNGNYQYSVDGGATWKATTATLVNDLPLVEGNNSFNVQEQDKAGNWSLSATNLVKVDLTGPKLVITDPAAGATLTSIHATLTGTASDAGTSVQSVTVSGQVSGSGVAVIASGNWTTGDLVLKSGPDTLLVTAVDAVGNSTKATLPVTVTVAAPQVVITYPSNNALTNKDTITVKYKVNGGAETSKAFSSLAEGSNSLTITSPPNEAGVTGSASITVVKDATAPNAPTVTVAKTPTNGAPSWTFTSGGDNAGGSGVASVWEYQLTGASNATGTLATAGFSVAGTAEGAYYLVVRQQDKAGNWSAYSALSTIVVDRTAPAVSVAFPANGFITSKSPLDWSCNFEGTVGAQAQPPKTLTVGSNTLTCQMNDAAGNPGSASVTVYYAGPVVFVTTSGAGSKDGSSWTNAMSDVQAAVTGAASGGKQVWMAGGHYSTLNVQSGLTFSASGVSLYGGFSPAGTAKSLTDRTGSDITYLASPYYFGDVISIQANSGIIQNVTLDGLEVQQHGTQYGVGMGNANNITFQKIRFSAVTDSTFAAIIASHANFTVESCQFNGFKTDYSIIKAQDGDLTPGRNMIISNTVFSANTMTSNTIGAEEGRAVSVQGYAKLVILNSYFEDFSPINRPFIGFMNDAGTVDVEGCVFNVFGQSGYALDAGMATVAPAFPGTNKFTYP